MEKVKMLRGLQISTLSNHLVNLITSSKKRKENQETFRSYCRMMDPQMIICRFKINKNNIIRRLMESNLRILLQSKKTEKFLSLCRKYHHLSMITYKNKKNKRKSKMKIMEVQEDPQDLVNLVEIVNKGFQGKKTKSQMIVVAIQRVVMIIPLINKIARILNHKINHQ